MPSAGHYSIGEVLALLQHDFPDVTISKIRFLESQGLIDPERTPSGYRRFFEADLARLRWILVQQRDHYLPLKVIRERLEAGEPFVEGPVDAVEGNGAAPTEAASDAADPEAPALEPAATASAGARAAAERRSGGGGPEGSPDADSTAAVRTRDRTPAGVGDQGPEAATVGAGDRAQGEVAPRAAATRAATSAEAPAQPSAVPQVTSGEGGGAVTRSGAAGRGGDTAPGPPAGPRHRSGRPAGGATRPSQPGPAGERAAAAAAGPRPATATPDPAPSEATATAGARSEDHSGAAGPGAGAGGPAPAEHHAEADRLHGSTDRGPERTSPGGAAGDRSAGAPAPVERRPTVGRVPDAARGPEVAATPIPQLGGPHDARPAGVAPGSPPAPTKAALSRDELAEASGCTVAVLVELEKYGLLHGRTAGTTVLYDPAAVEVARLAARLGAHGLEPRHLRSFRLSAEREVGMFAQVVAPLRRRRDPEARQQAQAAVAELVELASELHRAMVQRLLREELGSG